MMGKKWVLVLGLVFLLAFTAGCGKKDEAASSGVQPESGSSSGSGQQDASSASTADQHLSGSDLSGSMPTASSVPPEPVFMEGKFINTDPERYTAERSPYFVLSMDGTYEFLLNLGDGRLSYERGEYTLTGSSLTLTVLERDDGDYLGDDLDSHTLRMEGENHFFFTGDPVGMTRNNDQFAREGVAPLPKSVPGAASVNSGSPPDSRSWTRIPPVPQGGATAASQGATVQPAAVSSVASSPA